MALGAAQRAFFAHASNVAPSSTSGDVITCQFGCRLKPGSMDAWMKVAGPFILTLTVAGRKWLDARLMTNRWGVLSGGPLPNTPSIAWEPRKRIHGNNVAGPEGIEPPTGRLEAGCSIH